jgi:outer membrane lipoprotein LolB
VNAPGQRASWPPTLGIGALAVAVAGTLAGCTSLREPGVDTLAGRLSVRVEGESGEPLRSLAASFLLLGDAERGSLDLSTPLGTLLAQARWSPEQVLLITPQGRMPYADLTALTRDLLGESLPVAAFFDWLRGRPWPGAASSANRPPEEAGFVQLGWHVTLARFDEGYIAARHPGPPVVTVRAVLDRP